MGNLPERDQWAFDALKELLMKEKGFDLEAYKERCILRRVYLKLRSKGHNNLGSYYREIRRKPKELEALFQYLTIHVTEFFRNPSAFHFLENRVLPRLLTEHSGYEKFNIWSVGCSSGEEPYSLAIVVNRVLKEHGLSMPFQVLATDVDKKVIVKAREGLYKPAALKNLDGGHVRKYFQRRDGLMQVTEEIRELVVFQVANVLTDSPRTMQSLIVCRNLLIYFSRENQEKVITGFSNKLREGGHLMLGKAETLIGRNRLFFQSISPSERIYKKRDMPLEDTGPG
jgi:chemotaxis protein methyltransferase CheR